jgi:hypothetical protein
VEDPRVHISAMNLVRARIEDGIYQPHRIRRPSGPGASGVNGRGGSAVGFGGESRGGC